jgi:toxin ParE1/3/4
MIPIRFHSEAEAEMMAASVYYEEQQDKLGKRFILSVQNAVTRIQISPQIFPVVHQNVRRCITKTFPFNVLFHTQPDEILTGRLKCTTCGR